VRTADTILNIIRERSSRGLPLEDVYRLLYNPQLYLLAYGRISTNNGALTPGVTAETVDAMNLEKILGIIALIKREAYRWAPVRRIQIPKKKGGKRPLGIPTWSDKLLQEVLRLILEAHYEPRFSNSSHGFRPGRGCHTALREVTHWTGTKWFIEGDIKGCFDNIAHEVLLSTLAETIHDNRFLRLISNMLQAGYLEDWIYNKTLSGTPQGGVVSPILSNIYLDKLDKFVEQHLIQAFNRGKKRRQTPTYHAAKRIGAKLRKQGKGREAIQHRKTLWRMTASDPFDPHFRRLWYVRYADDFLLGFSGPKVEAEAIKGQLCTFLSATLKLELSQEKTLITHASTEEARFLGYEVTTQHRDDKIARGRRSANGNIALRVPESVIADYQQRYVVNGHPKRDWTRAQESDYTIVSHYGLILQGIYNYYQFAINAVWLSRVQWTLQNSMLHTLASKHKTTVRKVVKRLRTLNDTPDGKRICYEVTVQREGKPPLVARFAGKSLRRRPINVPVTDIKPYQGPMLSRNERITRLLHDTCELCEASTHVEGHHIRRLADLKKHGRKSPPRWAVHMSAMRRKTLYVCRPCHLAIHNGKLEVITTRNTTTGEPDEVKVSSPVRRGAVGKVLQATAKAQINEWP
jgi:group II intron reverse transcriptase/maturase